MPDINKYEIKNFKEIITEEDSLIGSSASSKKTKKFILKDIINFVKQEIIIDSPFELAVKNGFIGTESQWNESQKNIDGGLIF